ncbi:XVIPCD domain-containing protein [Lysobacter sp. Root983]|uniref:XVIPCD domain-containing protein n=1 Tax=Lysobacter sp. Root983 TaxID=1736613 RepID=UPI00070B5154|nr:XVIPCD domain-containing protein [Lysobacter sp. Root983]KRD77088.1 hypothetical protein ASE43_07925 [Lysobacter sp. Root983]
MAHEFIPTQLHGGGRVTLVKWEDEAPTQHGDDLQAKAWNPSHPRKGVGFYESTIDYMRNDWAIEHMSPTKASKDGKHLLLFHNAATDTWHSADALDIDHARKWKEHLTALKVDNYADANRAYNDVGNLRLLPSPVNRARESFETMLEEHGNDSPQTKAWVKKHFAFDPDAAHPAYDAESDLARRTVATTGRDWDSSEGRKGLSFDTRVLDKWFDHQLKESYAGSVEMTSPTTGKVTAVPLFHCAASGQLCTRDALDIDHEVPFEILAKEMVKYAEGGVATKANALDAFNETSNLRLVSRSANSSHEWELDQFGNYRDDEDPELSGEFDDFIDDEVAPMRLGSESRSNAAPPLAASAAAASPSLSTPAFNPLSSTPSTPVFNPLSSTPSFAASPTVAAAATGLGGAPQPSAQTQPPVFAFAAAVAAAPLMNDPRHPDHPLFAQALKCLQAGPGAKLGPTQQENAASSLAWVAKANQMTAIDQVAYSEGKLFVVQNPNSPGRLIASAGADLAASRTVEQNTSVIDKLPTPAKAPAPGQGQQQPMTY